MKPHRSLIVFVSLFAISPSIHGGTLVGHARDYNWYAQYQNNPLGVGYYELAVNANGNNLASAGGYDDTDVYGGFDMPNLPAGTYTVASWDVWWRSAFAFNVNVPASGSTVDVDLRLKSTMWGYPAFWDDAGYQEFGQTFEASGPVAMLYLRDPLRETFTRTITLHGGGPGGPQIGVTRTYGGDGDQRIIYGYGDMPTVKGLTYYLRIRTPSPSQETVIMQMDPRPDYSDPMPGGCLYLGNGSTLTAHPDRDLGVIIMSDDDGLITNLSARRSGNNFNNVTRVGQSFIARGVGLISAAFWLADPSDPVYVVRVRQDGPAGAQVGTVKRGKPARRNADPQMLVLWSPAECPLTPGQTYYLEVTRDGGGTFNDVFVNRYNPFAYGEAYQNGSPVSGTDLAGTIMEEESPGSATQPEARITVGPEITDIGSNQISLRWNTSVFSDSQVEYAIDAPPYTHSNYNSAIGPFHSMTIQGLQPHSLYHFRVRSQRAGCRPGISRDVVVCTLPDSPNLLANPGFEEGSGEGPARAVTDWTTGGLDIKAADGNWFSGIQPQSGNWLLQGAVNGGSSDGYAWQRVTGITPGKAYTFSAWAGTWHKENGTWKYDVWNQQGRLIYVQLGIDPTGGTDPNAGSVRWTPRFYSHRKFSNVAKTATAESAALTVFIRLKGQGGDWHLYGVDDCILTEKKTELAEFFESSPHWNSAFNNTGGGSAQWSIVPEGQEGNALQVANTQAGLSSRVLTFSLQPNTYYSLSVHGNCPESTTPYSAVCAFKLGSQAALQYEVSPDTWSVVKQFSQPGLNGNGSAWTRYSRGFFSEAESQISVLFRTSSEEGPPPSVLWDTLRIEPEAPSIVPLISLDEQTLWKYEQSGTDLGADWHLPEYDDSQWAAGPALLGHETDANNLPAPVRAPLTLAANKPTFYFRHQFDAPAGFERAHLRLRQVVDDGVVYYLNGIRVFALGLTNDPAAFQHLASRAIGDAAQEGPFDLEATLLPGSNVLAAEVHQVSPTSSDLIFGAELEAVFWPHEMPSTNAAITIHQQEAVVVINWADYNLDLESANQIAGPWESWPVQNAPVLLAATNASRFFRLRR